ncbi:MAG: hypothetical protein ACXVBE_00015 [Bdellovibrionota bacterium]
MKLFLTAVVMPTLLSASAFAALDLRQLPGRQTVTQSSADRTDYCILPKTLPGFTYRPKLLEKDQATEVDLCAINLYDLQSDAAACPKLNSTNPGIRIYKLKPEAGGRAKWEAAECGKSDPDGEAKQVAKFKQTLTCSYAPSPMAYYQISRVLDTQPIVPVAILRTMDARTHATYVKRGAAAARKLYANEPSSAILQGWTRLWPAAYQSKPSTLFDSSGTQVWGNLLDQPKGKELYKEVFVPNGSRFNYDTRYQDFKQTSVYLKLKNAAPLAPKLGTDFAKFAASMVQLKDVSDMILLDYLLNQQDRMGNIHYIPYYLYVEDGVIKDKKTKVAKDKDSDEDKAKVKAEQEAMKAKGAVVVKRMLLADNDCGVTKDNLMLSNQIFLNLNHMGLDTYRRLLWLATKLPTPEWKNFFRQELQFTQNDLEKTNANSPGLLLNAARAAKLLQDKCRKGVLSLDLNISMQLEGKNITDSKPYCDLPANYQPGV